MSSQRWSFVINTIYSLYGGKKIELTYATPFQLLCAVILSAQTTDKQVNKITPPFFERVKNPQDILFISIEEIESYLRYVNFFRNKSRFIKETWIILATQYDGIIPNDLKLIQTFPGIGIKTAKVVLSVLYDMPYVWVDTHIHRVVNRIGIVTTQTPNETDKKIEEIFTKKEQRILHHPFVLFGRYQCIARKPKCETCPIQKKCAYYKTHFSKKADIL